MFTSYRFGMTAILASAFLSFSLHAAIEIDYRSFSGVAAIGPPADAYADKLEEITATALGEQAAIRFRRISPTPGIPEKFNGDVAAAVAAGERDGGFDAAYVPGVSINGNWGFIYTSGVPFGPNFDEFAGFLFGNSVDNNRKTGLQLLQGILDQRGKGIVVVPIVGGSEQGSGYFMEPVGDVGTENCARARHGKKINLERCKRRHPEATIEAGIGLTGLCQRHWTFRYLPPAQQVLDGACDELLYRGKIAEKNIDFIVPVPGAGVFEAMIAGEIQAFEVATPLDDVSALFSSPLGNPGTVGARFLHYPGWHQPFLITYMIINKPLWLSLNDAQRSMIMSTGRDHVLSSYGENLRQQGGKLQEILEANKDDDDRNNDMVLVQWPRADLARLKRSTIRFLNSRKNDYTLPAQDREDYIRILEALRNYVSDNNGYWKVRGVRRENRFTRWKDRDTNLPWDQIFND